MNHATVPLPSQRPPLPAMRSVAPTALTACGAFGAAIALVALLGACASEPPAPAATAAPVVESPTSRGPILRIEQTPRGVQIVLPSVVLFEVGKSSFNNTEAAPYLERVARLLTTKTQQRVAVEGHTDSDGTAALNEGLAKARAGAVAEALATRGVITARIEQAGYSFNRPVASNATEEGKRLNRRVEIIVLDEKVENITHDEPAGSFESAFARLRQMVESGLVKLPAGTATASK